MKFISTRNRNKKFSLSQSLLQGLAPDGGLFMPETLPTLNYQQWPNDLSYADFCEKALEPFFVGDRLQPHLPAICKKAFNFPAPVTKIDDTTLLLELFHGPTLSFKDFGARFLATSLSYLAEEPITIMVATSGDTGSAVASAFHQQKNIEVIILFPKDKISLRQQQQITCWGDNVKAYAVEGNFDDCQKFVKQAFTDLNWKKKNLCTANSINIGRLLPQIGYYAYTSTQFEKSKQQKANFIVPSGNLGNVCAAFLAKQMGFPIANIVIASNANRVVVDYLKEGQFQPRASIVTLANAMDVGAPSNFERLQFLLPDLQSFQEQFQAFSCTDDEIKKVIEAVFQKYNIILCPHTATGYYARQFLDGRAWIIAATAEPSKFETVIEPIIQQPVPVAENLTNMLNLPSNFQVISVSELSKLV